MTSKQLKNFIKYLQKSNIIIGPKKEDGNLVFDKIDGVEEIELSNHLPLHSFKRFLLPNKEILSKYEYCRNEAVPRSYNSGEQMVFFGLTAPDLKAISILNHIFEKDLFYQNRKKNILIVGYISLPEEFKGHFAVRYEEDFLEHIQFDIFIAEDSEAGDSSLLGVKIFVGSRDGQRVLDDFGYSNYENVQFAGLVKEEGIEQSMIKVWEAMKKLKPNSKIFKDLGERCIECGRCAIICPLCYCFCLDDEHPNQTGDCRMRNLTTCFYSEFSEVAGGHKFLNNPAERIYNWYEHKFVRFPSELSVAGCVSCGRCTKVCPVGIDIKEVISELVNL